MAESRLTPCNLMAWPRVRNLLPDQKLITYHLWASCPEACGCCLLDLGAFQGALNITIAALQEALREFQRRGLVAMDEETGEVFILDWFRFHKFNTGVRQRLLADSLRRVQSPDLRALIEKTMSYSPREGKAREGKKTEREAAAAAVPSPAAGGGYSLSPDGITYQPGNQRDESNLEKIKAFNKDEVDKAVQDARGEDPEDRAFTSKVLAHLKKARAGNEDWQKTASGIEKKAELLGIKSPPGLTPTEAFHFLKNEVFLACGLPLS